MLNNLFIFFIIYLFLIIILLSLFFTKNPVFLLLFLILSFLISSFILLSLNCDFLAFFLIIIYAGAIAILFLFTIMVLDIKFNSFNYLLKNIFPKLICLFTIFFCISYFKINIFYQITDNFLPERAVNFINWKLYLNFYYDILTYSLILYDFLIIELLLIGYILLLILIGIIYLINTYLNYNIKNQNINNQLANKSKFYF